MPSSHHSKGQWKSSLPRQKQLFFDRVVSGTAPVTLRDTGIRPKSHHPKRQWNPNRGPDGQSQPRNALAENISQPQEGGLQLYIKSLPAKQGDEQRAVPEWRRLSDLVPGGQEDQGTTDREPHGSDNGPAQAGEQSDLLFWSGGPHGGEQHAKGDPCPCQD